MASFSEQRCVICRKDFIAEYGGKAVRVSEGRARLLECCLKCNHSELADYLLSNPSTVNVHECCRRQYLNDCYHQVKRPADDSVNSSAKSKFLRSATGAPAFDWKTLCFLCGKSAVVDKKHPNRSIVHEAKSDKLMGTMLQICDERQDNWGFEVKGRLLTCGDLHAADAVYHGQCHRNFMKYGRCRADVPGTNVGRSPDSVAAEVFGILCSQLECEDCELYTLHELVEQMQSLCDSSCSAYSAKYMKQKLQERYGDELFFADIFGRKNVVCFKNMAQRIITDKWYADREEDVTKDGYRIVEAAAKLIKGSIRECLYRMDEYPTSEAIGDKTAVKEWVPDLLRSFLQNIVTDEVKQIALGHSIVQASRPRSVISPVLFGVGVSIDHMFGSSSLLKKMSRLGFSASADEVLRFKQSVVQTDGVNLPASGPDMFTQWSADNVDHNVATLDGQGTFHGMGIMSMSVRCMDSETSAGRISCGSFGEKPIKRLARVNSASVVKGKGIPLHYYSQPNLPPLQQLYFRPISELNYPYILPDSVNDNLLWQVGWYFRGTSEPRPNWSGFMESVSVGEYLPPAEFHLLPIIDLEPGNRSCILSTLLFIISQAKLLNMETPCVTLDQPLWIKAVEVATSQSLNIVCRMGVFHMIMSFLGSIGTVMAGSGLVEALECCYGPNALTHMMNGRAVARAVRAHFLADSALWILLLRSLLDVDSESYVGPLTSADLQELRSAYDGMVARDSTTFEEVQLQTSVVKLDLACRDQQRTLSDESRTAKLWIQYSHYVDVLRTTIRAERTGDWNMHLVAVSKMLNLFAATGHCHYAKSARLYLQMMLDLPHTHPWLYNKFQAGFNTVRRSDRFWAGLSTDLAIEQVMMKAVKGRGGLTHGRGMTDSVRSLWIHSLHQSASVHAALSHLTCANEAVSLSHPELGKGRSSRDFSDLNKILNWFAAHNPFAVDDGKLRSISTGFVAADEDGVNCDLAEEVGQGIMQTMDKQAFTDTVMKRSSQLKALSHLGKKVKVGKGHIVIDPNVLFSRLLLVMAQSGCTETCFEYELTPVPASLFKGEGLRKTNKAALAKEMTKSVDTSLQINFTGAHVLDGGCLLHKVVWPKGGTYGDVLRAYSSHIARRYMHCTVVFDGYSGRPTVKDSEHIRRATQPGPTVTVMDNLPVYHNQSAFLTNTENKRCFVQLLMSHLQEYGYAVLQAHDDADTLIAKTALDLAAKTEEVMVVADDTDVLVLLVHHFASDMSNIYMMSEITRARSARQAIISVREVCDAVGETGVRQILAVHALSGCDTTSALFGHGKASVFRKVQRQTAMLPLTDLLTSHRASQTEVVDAGLQILVMLYGGKVGDSLNHLRYAVYMNLIATRRTQPRPERLPPTERAARFHIMRVHLQAVQWKTLSTDQLNPMEWGWTVANDRLVPVTTDLQPAPDDLLNVITCKCKVTTKKPCSSQLCSCRKHGLPCLASCKYCCGEDCENAAHVVPADQVCDDVEENHSDKDTSDEESDFLDDESLAWIDEEVVVNE